MKLQDISELYRGYEDKVIDGKKIGGEIEETVKTEVKRYTEQYGSVPTLGTVLVGEDPPSQLYVKLKHWACKRVGIKSQNYHLEESASEKEVIEVVDELNLDDGVNGILVQMPLPNHIDQSSIMQLIDPLKDVDGFNPLNMGRLMQGDESWLVACTPRGIIEALDYYDIDIEGQHVVIVGHSNIVGKPMAALFMNRNATVSVCHVYTKDLSAFTRDADIL
ncbi:MAG: bifunctional 5,10-methylenetetrahydrofolate dehydrogenase/5,10-methenyltetrahydrofolate cyclohydrolase, partial [Methermicoccaceae archaeon]